MLKKLAYFTLLEAPGGYGKTFYIEKTCKQFSDFPVLRYFHHLTPESFFEKLEKFANCNINNWENITLKNSRELVLIFDDFHMLEPLSPIQSFISCLIKNPPLNFHLFISSRYPVNLAVSGLIASGKGIFLSKSHLNFSLEKFKKLCGENKLNPVESDFQFYNCCQGWPLGIMLFLKYRTGVLVKEDFDLLLFRALSETLSDYKDKSDLNLKLKYWFTNKEIHPQIFENYLLSILKTNPHYWNFYATKTSLQPKERQLYLERAMNLAKNQNNLELLLNILTRLAHSYSLSGEYLNSDMTLDLAEPLLDKGKTVDKIAWMYMKANRFRQICNHQEAIIILKEILNLECSDEKSLNFQTRTRVVLGLTYYQKGNYDKTRKYYNDALLLATAENNETLCLEITIMLAFLDAYEGKNNDILPEDIIDKVEKQSLKVQPLMWLNLAFYWLLGEKLDVKLGMNILNKIKYVTNKLDFEFLIPLISDVEARIFRLNHEYGKAFDFHRIVLSILDERTFEYLQAKLNFALTLFKEDRLEEAEKVLNSIVERSLIVEAFGVVREARVLLNEIKPAPKLNQENLETKENNNIIILNMFGNFEIKIGSRKITKWGRKKSRHLLIHLILNPKGIHRESLADLIFSSETLDYPLKNLDVSVHGLRKVLEPERKIKESSFIEFQDSCYRFNWNYPHYIDLLEFEHLFREWKTKYLSDALFSSEIAFKILNIYKGDLLPEPDFAGLWLEERENCRRKAILINNWLIEYLFNHNYFEEAEFWSEKLISIDNINENGYLFLMKIADWKKDKIFLKNIYQRMIATYQKELDETPSENILYYYNSIYKKYDL